MTPLDPDAKKRAGDVCKGCRAEILWATTRPGGKAMPVDPELVYGGNITLEVDDVGMLIARHVKPSGTVEGYVAHFTSCSVVDEFRKPKEGADHEEQNGARRKALQVRMPFGKFAGQTLEEVDRDKRGHEYLRWALRNLEWRRTDVRDAIATVLGVEP